MARTEVRGGQIKDTSVQRDDLDIITTGQAVVRRIIAGTNINIGSTGVDTGTGDVTINASGVTLTGSLNELLKYSTASAAIGTKVFSAADGDITLGDAGLAGTARNIVAAGSGTNIEVNINSKGTGHFYVGNNGTYIWGGSGGGSIIELGLGTSGSVQVGSPAVTGTVRTIQASSSDSASLLNLTGKASGVQATFNASVKNAMNYALDLAITGGAGTYGVGIGTGLRFKTFTSSANEEIGAAIEAVTTDLTSTTEAFDLVFKTMQAGTAPAQRLKLSNNTAYFYTTSAGDVDNGQYIFNSSAANNSGTSIAFGNNGVAAGPLVQLIGTQVNSTNSRFNVFGVSANSAVSFFKIDGNLGNQVQVFGPLKTKDYTTAGLPAAASHTYAIAYDTTLGKLVYSDGAAWAGMGGVTNSGANNEIVKSNGTNLVGTGVQSTAFGNVTLGTAAEAGLIRTISAVNSTSDAALTITAQSTLLLQTGASSEFQINANDISLNSTRNLSLVRDNGDWQSGDKIIFVGQAITAPTGNPTTGAYFWVDSATQLPKWRTPGGTVYTLTDTGGGGDMLLGTSQTVSASKIFNDNTLLLDDSDSAFNLILRSTSTITTANKSLTFDVNDANRIITLTGDLTLAGNFTTTGAFNTTFAFTGSNTINFPNVVGMTVARIDAAQTFTGIQSMTSPAVTTSLTTPSTTFGLVDATATTVNFAGAATTLNIGNATAATVTLRPGTLVGAATTQNVYNTVATTVNAFGAATTFVMGGTPTTALTATLFGNATATATTKAVNIATAGAAGSTTNVNIGSAVASAVLGTLSLNFPTILTASNNLTVALWNTNSTTINFAGAATTFNLGGTPTTALTATLFGNATATATTKTINIGTAGAAGSTTNINIGSAVASAVLGTILLNSPWIDTSTNNLSVTLWQNPTTISFAAGATTANLFSGFTSAQTINLGTSSTGASTYNFGTGPTLTATTKVVNIGTAGVSGSVTNILLGSAVAGATGTTTIHSTTINFNETPATDAGFSTSQLLTRDSTGNVDVIAASGGGTTNFLRADGTWAAAGGSGWAVTGNTNLTGVTTITPTTTNTLSFVLDDASTNTPLYPFAVKRSTSGIAAAGIGTGISFHAESADGLLEYGTLALIVDTITSANVDSSFKFSAFTNGAFSYPTYIHGRGIAVNSLPPTETGYHIYAMENSASTARLAVHNASTGDAELMAWATGAGDAYTYYFLGGGSDWLTGVDNSDGDAYVITQGATLGTNNLMKIATTGLVTFNSNVGGGGTANFLRADGTWATPAAAITVGTSTISGGVSGRIPYNAAGVYQESAAFSWSAANNALTVNEIVIHSTGGSGFNTFVGKQAGNFTLTGTANTVLGYRAGEAITTGNNNVLLGNTAAYLSTGSAFNVVIGAGAAGVNSIGNSNILIGYYAGRLLSTGTYNICIGEGDVATGITSGSNNIIIGKILNAPTGNTASDQLNIQAIIFGTGNSATGSAISTGNIGIGTNAPDRRFHVELDSATTNAVTYLQRLTSTSSGVVAIGIGVGIEFEVEATGNFVGSTVEAVTTAVGATPSFDLVFKTMAAGAAAAERMRLTSESSLRLASRAGDPGTLANGDIWYDSTAGKFRARQNGTSFDLISGVTGTQDMVISAAAMAPTITAGCSALTKVEAATNDVNYFVLDFDQTTSENAFFTVAMPRNWNFGSIAVIAHWTFATGTGNVTWAVKAALRGDDDAIDQAWGGEISLTADTALAAGDVHTTAKSGAITPAGTLGDNKVLFVNVRRVSGGLTGDARLIAIKLIYTIDSGVTE